MGLAAYMLVENIDFWWETMKWAHNTEAMT